MDNVLAGREVLQMGHREGVALEPKEKKEEARREIEEGTKLGVENLVHPGSCSKGSREHGAEPGRAVEPLL